MKRLMLLCQRKQSNVHEYGWVDAFSVYGNRRRFGNRLEGRRQNRKWRPRSSKAPPWLPEPEHHLESRSDLSLPVRQATDQAVAAWAQFNFCPAGAPPQPGPSLASG